jgi:hypothetical protein
LVVGGGADRCWKLMFWRKACACTGKRLLIYHLLDYEAAKNVSNPCNIRGEILKKLEYLADRVLTHTYSIITLLLRLISCLCPFNQWCLTDLSF